MEQDRPDRVPEPDEDSDVGWDGVEWLATAPEQDPGGCASAPPVAREPGMQPASHATH